MTPQERQLMRELFDRLATLENTDRDPDAEAMIREGFRRAPNSAYALVQTVLVQDEALKAANAHIQQLEQQSGTAQQAGEEPRGFLDSMRDSLFGREPPRGSVPRVPAAGVAAGAPMGAPAGYRGDARSDPWGQQQGFSGGQPQGYPGGAPMQMPMQGGGGGSFLGTAAAAAAGVIGGSLLMGGIRSALGNHQGTSPAASAFDSLAGRGEDRSPWSGSSGGDLAREAGLNDIGGRSGSGGGDQARPSSLFGSSQDSSADDDDGDGFDGDDGVEDA